MNPTSKLSLSTHFAHFEENEFCDWLSSGFKVFYARKTLLRSAARIPTSPIPSPAVHEGLEPRPFDFAYSLIGRRESLLDDIEFIYEQYIPEDKKIVFRRSLGRLLRQSTDDAQFPEPAISDLIYIMAKVRAHESLESLAPVVGRGKYGVDKQWLQYEAIATLKTLLPAREAILGLRDLVTLQNFHEAYSFDVLIALCRAEPTDWLSAFELLRGRIANLWEEARKVDDAAVAAVEEEGRKFTRMFADLIPTNEIAMQLPDIKVSNSPAGPYASGIWFPRNLFAGDTPPIKILHEESSFSDDSITVPIEVTIQPSRRAIMVCDSHEYRFLYSLNLDFNPEDFLNRTDDTQPVTAARVSFVPLLRSGIRRKVTCFFSRNKFRDSLSTKSKADLTKV